MFDCCLLLKALLLSAGVANSIAGEPDGLSVDSEPDPSIGSEAVPYINSNQMAVVDLADNSNFATENPQPTGCDPDSSTETLPDQMNADTDLTTDIVRRQTGQACPNTDPTKTTNLQDIIPAAKPDRIPSDIFKKKRPFRQGCQPDEKHLICTGPQINLSQNAFMWVMNCVHRKISRNLHQVYYLK